MTAQFMWYELLTDDTRAAERFYTEVVGWKAEKMGEGDSPAYTVYATDKGGVAGMPSGADIPAGPVWVGYVGVDDVDAYAERVKQAGGTIHQPPTDIPGIGRFAMVADPQGAVFNLFKGNQPEGPPTGDGPGYTSWHELATSDPKGGLAFYEKLFGWKPLDAMDMGPGETYQIFSEDGQAPAGGILRAGPQRSRPGWTYYFNVDSASAAVARAKAAGATITNGPIEVPGGQWSAQGTDPQGASFAVVGGK